MHIKTSDYELMVPYLSYPEVDDRLIRNELKNSFSHCSNSLIFPRKRAPGSRLRHLRSDETVHKRRIGSTPKNSAPKEASHFFNGLELDSPTRTHINQLEQDLALLRDQLECLIKNKNFIIGILTELHDKYQQLLLKNKKQENEIQTLKSDNVKLFNQAKERGSGENMYLINVTQSLGLCEQKLNRLDQAMFRLLKSYQSSKESEVRCEREKEKLTRTNNELRAMLVQVINDLEKFQKNGAEVKSTPETYEHFSKLEIERHYETPEPTSSFNQESDHVDNAQEISQECEQIISQLKGFEEDDNKQSDVSQNEINPPTREATEYERYQRQIYSSLEKQIKILEKIDIIENGSGTLITENEVSAETADDSQNFSDCQYMSVNEDYELECICELCDEP